MSEYNLEITTDLSTDIGGIKVCTVCNEQKPFDEFYNRIASDDGKAYRCKVCDNIAVAAYRVKHKDRQRKQQRESNWRFKYGLEREDFEKMWENQEGKCPICFVGLVNIEINGDPVNKGNTACVDHCHESGKVRGILCAKCNKALGLLHDDLDFIQRAYDYIEHHQAISEIH